MTAADAAGSDESSHQAPVDRDRVGPVELTVSGSIAELAADRLWQLGASAVGEIGRPDGAVALVADVDPAAAARLALELGGTSRVLEPQASWDTGWHDAAQVWTCGRTLLVRPHWLDPEPDVARGRVQVVLDPGVSFGAGSHPSTRLALAALEPLAPGAHTVLDVGAGTGVLGVGALLLGAERLVAIDVDDAAVSATRRAFELNGVVDRARVDNAPLDEVPETYDLVLANLLVPVLEQLGPALAARVSDRGALVLSGVLAEQLERAVRALSPLVLVEQLELDGWCAAVLAPADGV